MNKITMLGTGNATVTQCYNTCFVLDTSTTRLLVDAGGGNGVLGQLKKVGDAGTAFTPSEEYTWVAKRLMGF